MAYGSKQVAYYNYMKAHPEYTHLFTVDAHDVFVLGTMEEALSRIEDKDVLLFNAEKGCYPDPEKAALYPRANSEWRYVNGGCAFVYVPLFIQMFEENPIAEIDNDQRNLTDIFLSNKYNFVLDYKCRLFQSIAFRTTGEFGLYSWDNKNYAFENYIFGTKPIIIHGNGRTPMDWVYKILPTNV